MLRAKFIFFLSPWPEVFGKSSSLNVCCAATIFYPYQYNMKWKGLCFLKALDSVERGNGYFALNHSNFSQYIWTNVKRFHACKRINSGTNISNSNKVTLEKERPRFCHGYKHQSSEKPWKCYSTVHSWSLSNSPQTWLTGEGEVSPSQV